MPRHRKTLPPLPPMATMVYKTSDASADQPLLRSDASRLFTEGKIVQVYVSNHGGPHYMMPRSYAQILRDEHPSFSLEVRECIDRARELLKDHNLTRWS